MPETVIDFSENVNPLGPPAFVNRTMVNVCTSLITKYPDPLGEPFLSAAANYHDVSSRKRNCWKRSSRNIRKSCKTI